MTMMQMLLRQRVQEIGADTCKNCCLTSMACTCRQPYGFQHGVTTSYYMQEHDQNNGHGNIRNIYVAAPAHGEGNGHFRPVRVHVRGPVDGLAGIGRGATFVPAGPSPPTRFVFSRVPFGVGNRNGQQSQANDDPDTRADHTGELPGDGLTALVGLSQGANNVNSFQGDKAEISGASTSGPSTSAIPMRMVESPDHGIGIEWQNSSSSISLDAKTPLSHFPPFRFG